MPKVSVVIPTCNRPEMLKKAIESVLTQTYQDFEIIIVDDGVVQRAGKAVAKLKDPRIKYIQHQTQKGGAAARNTGIENARGSFIAFLDDDDEWLPEKLERQVDAFASAGSEVGVVFCGVAIFNKEGNLLKENIFPEEGVVDIFEKLLHKCFIWTSSIIMRRELVDKGAIFDIDFKKNQEWDLELRLAKITKFYSIKKALVRLNMLDDDEHMGGSKNIDNIICGLETLIKKHYSEYQMQKKSFALRFFQLAELYFRKRDFSKTRSMIFNAWLNQPFNFVYFKHLVVSCAGRQFYKYLKNINEPFSSDQKILSK